MTAATANAATLRSGLGELASALQRVAADSDLVDTVGPLVAECSRPTRPVVRVVIAGAAKRGKSALVNALVGRPGLVPVDSDVATGVHIALRHGDRDRAVVHLDGRSIDVGLDEIAAYASERQNPGNTRGVLAVEVELPAPVLAGGLELVDTPGVDSVITRHADVTLAALGLADALVLVVDPSRPLTTPELTFLRAATERIGRLVFVLTKTDLHQHWEQVLADDRALVATHAPRFAGAPFLPVSGRLKTVADEARGRGRDALADRAEEQSGTSALAAELGRIADDRDLVRLGNAVQLALVVVARLTIALRAARPTDDPAAADEVAADQATLRALSEGGTRWRQDLAHGVRRLQYDLDARLAAATADADEALTGSLSPWRAERGESLGRELDDAVRALWFEAASLVAERVQELVDDLVAAIAAQGVVVARPELTMPELAHAGARALTSEDDPTSKGLAGALGSWGAAAGLAFGAERLLMPLGLIFGMGGLGIGAAIGLAGLALRRRSMDRVREQRAAHQLVTRTLAEARQQLQRQFAKHLSEVSYHFETTVADLLAARRQELGDAVARGRADLERSAGERRARLAAIDAHLTTLERLRTDAGALHQVALAATRARR